MPLGLTKIGINHTTLPPGKESSMRHWHTHEDEFIFVLSGEVVVRTDAGEQVLTAGMCAGFPASRRRQDRRRSPADQSRQEPVVYLEISNRDPRDKAFYPDVDLHFHGAGAAVMFTRKDGSHVLVQQRGAAARHRLALERRAPATT